MPVLSLFVTCCSFFFSSRRRHTRSLCDWSSDVCSSDLRPVDRSQRLDRDRLELVLTVEVEVRLEDARSEERRVGKECRSRGSAYDEKETRRERPDAGQSASRDTVAWELRTQTVTGGVLV